MRSIWETLKRLFEADEDPVDQKIKARLARAHAAMKDKPPKGQSQNGDEPAALGGQARFQGAPDTEGEPLPKPDQPAPGTAAGVGAGRIAAKQAEPTSVSLGARARKVNPGVSGIKQKFGVSPDAFFSDAPVKVDPQTGKQYQLRGRPKKGQPDADKLQLKQEPFADRHAAAMARATTPQDRPKPTSYDAGAWSQLAGAHLPKGGEIRQTGKGQNVGASRAGGSKLVATGDEPRKGDFHGQRFAPAGHTAADDEEWAEDPALSARRIGGATGKRMRYDMPSVGQAGRMSMPARPGQGAQSVWNAHTQSWQSPEEFGQANSELRAKLAAKLAMRGADQANRMSAGKRPWAGTAQAPGTAVPKDANTQKADARASAIASKPLPVNIRRDDETPAEKGAKAAAEPPKAQGGGQPIDREKLKQMIAQRLAARAAKK